MVKKVSMYQAYVDSLSCEPLITRVSNGEILCVFQSGGTCEPAKENRTFFMHSKDNGKSWTKKQSILEEKNCAVYCTGISVIGKEITAFLTLHNGTFIDMKSLMVKSHDNGYTWEEAGEPPFFPNYTFIRDGITLSNGNIMLAYQHYPITEEDYKKAIGYNLRTIWKYKKENCVCESGVLISSDGGKNFVKSKASEIGITWESDTIWSEPTVVELSDHRIVMLMRCDDGFLLKSESADFGRSWSKTEVTDIPNPSNKARLIKLDKNRIALIHTPNSRIGSRYPYELWISDDDMKSWKEKVRLTDFPGAFNYTDGFYEDGHIYFTIEHNRHTIIFFDVEMD